MNIAYVVPEFVTELKGGGLASYINNIAQILAKRGHQITIIVKSEVNERFIYRENITVERVHVDLSKVDPKVPGSFYCEWSKVLNQRLWTLHEREPFDVAQYANWNALALYRTSIPTVVRISSDLPCWRAANTLQYDPRKKYPCVNKTDHLEDLSLTRADAVFSPSHLLANIISERTGVPIEVIESPFEQKDIQEDHTVYQNMLLDKPYILSFGNLNLLKGCKLIGDVIYDVFDSNDDILYVFAGQDHGWTGEQGEHVSAIEYIKKQAREYADRVVYLGALDRERLYPVIQNSLLCVMPSRVDNLPNACIEAMALGKLVIGTYGASFEQLIHDHENGILVEQDNLVALKSAIIDAIHMPSDDRQKMGKCAIARTKDLSGDIIADKTIEFYRKAVEKKAAQNG